MTTEAIQPEAAESKAQEIVTLVVNSYPVPEIKTNKDFEQASHVLKILKERVAEARSYLDPVVESAHKAHKRAVELRSNVLAPLEERSKAIRAAVATYTTEQERKAAEERRRIEAERREAEEAARKEAEAKIKEGAPIEEAVDLVEKAQRETERAVARSQMEHVPPKTGVTTATRWVWDLDPKGGLKKLIAAVACGRAPLEVLDVNRSAINKIVTRDKAATSLPGVVVREQKSVRV